MARSDTRSTEPQPGADSDGFGGDAPQPANPEGQMDAAPTLPPGGEVVYTQPVADEPPLPEAEPVGELTDEPPVAITLRHHWTDNDGKAHGPEAELTVDAFTADQLVAARFATKGHASTDQSAPEGEPAE